MTPAHSQHICPEWENWLVSWQMSVPQQWCLIMLGSNLHQDFIELFLEDKIYGLLKMDDFDEETMYPVQWDAVLKYTDIEAGTFASYRLPAVSIHPPADETEIAGKKYV